MGKNTHTQQVFDFYFLIFEINFDDRLTLNAKIVIGSNQLRFGGKILEFDSVLNCWVSHETKLIVTLSWVIIKYVIFLDHIVEYSHRDSIVNRNIFWVKFMIVIEFLHHSEYGTHLNRKQSLFGARVCILLV